MWGATFQDDRFFAFHRVSIHAPVWGATGRCYRAPMTMLFQSTHPCGVRLCLLMCWVTVLVSIHAPVWGATKSTTRTQTGERFQSTHPCGVRPLLAHSAKAHEKFQSTHPCGVRLFDIIPIKITLSVSIHAPVWGATYKRFYARAWNCFNPRTRVGCDG